MTLFLHELKRNRLSLIIWTAVLSFMLLICVVIYPEMKAQMGELSEMFANMGSFSDAFGMDTLMDGGFFGYFAVECGEVLGIGGALFASILGINALAKEQKDGTAEFLLSHPLSRAGVVTQKLLAVTLQITILNLIITAVAMISTLLIGEELEFKKMLLLFLSYYLLQIEIGALTFGISAFLRSNGIGFGLGIGLGAYFLNIAANLTEELEFLKYITPFGYTDGTRIAEEGSLDALCLLIGAVITVAGIVTAYARYMKKDIL